MPTPTPMPSLNLDPNMIQQSDTNLLMIISAFIVLATFLVVLFLIIKRAKG